ncbi:MAG: SMC-Scp complex subunit ScpB [Candidatus Hydrothermarchaeales archaeon]
MKLKQLIEASLFVSTNPLSLEELCDTTGCSSKSQIQKSVESLMTEYDQNNGALEISRIADDKYAMQVKKEFVGKVSNLVEPEVSEDVLKTLSFIALKQTITQADVVKARGYLAYDHVRELTNKEFIFAEPKGRTKVLTTTPKFSEYFGLESKDPLKIRSQIEKTLREL